MDCTSTFYMSRLSGNQHVVHWVASTDLGLSFTQGILVSGGSRIFPLGGRQPVGGGGGGGANLGRVHFSAKMYAKMKEIDPVGGGGGGRAGGAPPLDPPMLV